MYFLQELALSIEIILLTVNGDCGRGPDGPGPVLGQTEVLVAVLGAHGAHVEDVAAVGVVEGQGAAGRELPVASARREREFGEKKGWLEVQTT